MTTYFIFGLGPRLAEDQHGGVFWLSPTTDLVHDSKKKNKNTYQTTIKGKLHKKYLWKNEDMEKLHPPPS